MKIVRFFLLVSACFLLISCEKSAQFTKYVNKQLAVHYPKEAEQYEFIVVIPRQGCHACIKTAEDFFTQMKENANFLFIFTRIDSQKKLGLEIGTENLGLENVRIDKEDLFFNNKYYDSNYPLLLHKDENGTFNYQKLSPG